MRAAIRRPHLLRGLDIAVLALIVASVFVVMIDSVQELHAQYGKALYAAEWAFTLLFTAEYAVRLFTARKPAAYARSFFGIVDLVSILPTCLAFFFPGLHALIDVRLLRLLRVFRIRGLAIYLEEGQMLISALARARRKIFVFIGGMFVIVVILGTVIFLVEGPENGITSIPVGVYWAAVTMSTTGYGDLTPHTPLGRLITSCAILHHRVPDRYHGRGTRRVRARTRTGAAGIVRRRRCGSLSALRRMHIEATRRCDRHGNASRA